MLVSSMFSFSHNVLNRFLPRGSWIVRKGPNYPICNNSSLHFRTSPHFLSYPQLFQSLLSESPSPFLKQALVFTCLQYKSFEKKKKKNCGERRVLKISNFSFSHSVFHPFREHYIIFIEFEIVICNRFQF